MRKNTCLSIIAFSILTVFGYTAYASDFSASQTQEIQEIVHAYLINSPEVLVEASKALQQKQMDAMQSNAMKGIMDNKTALFAATADPVAGNVNGDITIVEFFDYQCPHCIDMMPTINALISKNTHLRVVFKEFPIFGNISNFASRAALAADKQGKYFEMHDGIMNAKKRLSKDIILQIAKNLSLNLEQLQKDMNDPSIDQMLNNNRDLAKALQLVGTPAFIVGPTDPNYINNNNTTFIAGQTTEEALQDAIDKA